MIYIVKKNWERYVFAVTKYHLDTFLYGYADSN